MDVNIRILSDAAEAIEKFVGAFGKFGEMLLKGFGKGVEISDYKKVREIEQNLRKFIVLTNGQHALQTHQYIPAIKMYLDEPSDGMWNNVKFCSKRARMGLDLIISDLSFFEEQIAAEDYYSDLIGVVMARQNMLTSLESMSPPNSPDELLRLKDYADKYEELVVQLGKINRTIGNHVKELKKEGKWPAS